MLAIYDMIFLQETKKFEVEDKPDTDVYENAQGMLRIYLLRPRWRYILPTAALSIGCNLVQRLMSPLNSTYICPLIGEQTRTVPIMQYLSLYLDSVLAFAVYKMSKLSQVPGKSSRAPLLWSLVLVGTVIIWGITAVVVYFAYPEERHWLWLLDLPSQFDYISATFWQTILFSVLCVSTLHCVSEFPPSWVHTDCTDTILRPCTYGRDAHSCSHNNTFSTICLVY